MVVVHVVWAEGQMSAYVRDPVLRGKFVCGVLCNEVGVASRSEGCTEDTEMRILRSSITSYEEAVL